MNDQYTSKKQIILIVDDDTSIRMTARMILELQDHIVIEADSGESCLEICQVQKPDMILLDAVMPGIDGFACAKQIKDIFGMDCPPIFMMTALDDRDSIYRSFDVGITDYFVKPLDWKGLPQKIERVVLINSCTKSIKQQSRDMYQMRKQMNSNSLDTIKSNQERTLNLKIA